MGYLDNSTIVVDAVLTKEGRQRLSQGHGLEIGFFTLSDMGVDYRLWNPDHPSGSAFYGEAIENLPSLEAIPRQEFYSRNKLISLNQSITGLPYWEVKPPGETTYSSTPPEITLNDANDDASNTGIPVDFKLSNQATIGNILVIIGNQNLLAGTSPLTVTSPANIAVTDGVTPSGQSYQSLVNTDSQDASYHTFNLANANQGFFQLTFKRGTVTGTNSTSCTIIDENTGIYKSFTLSVTGITS